MNLVALAFNPQEWEEPLKHAMARPLSQAMAHGAVAELKLNQAALKRLSPERARRILQKQEVPDRLDIDIPPGVTTDFPEWLKEQIAKELKEIFAQPYWLKINQTTRDDIAGTVTAGMREGWSIRRIAQEIQSRHGSAYTRSRATAVARSEIGAAMNAGHREGMRRLQDETGLQVGKEYLSVLGMTTRDTHAAADGQVVDTPDGLFNIGGYEAPYPGHHSLPAKERVNCLCTILSALVGEATREEPEPPVSGDQPDDATLSQAELNRLPILQALGKAERPNKILAAVLKAEPEGLAELHQNWQRLEGELAVLRAVREANPSDREIFKQWLEKNQERFKAKNIYVARRDEGRQAAMKVLRRPNKDRVKLKPKKLPKGTRYLDGSGLRESTGEYTPAYDRRLKTATKFLDSITSNRGDPDGINAALNEHLRAHAAERGVRAFQRSQATSYRDHDRDGIFLDPDDEETTFIHELGHWLENHLPGAKRRAAEFRAARIRQSGKDDVRLIDVFPTVRLKPDEMGNDDDFLKAFAAVDGAASIDAKAKAFYAGKHYPSGDTELVSMGLELLYADPVAFAKADPDYFRFIVGILDGQIQ